jgi:hypothetical protein
VNLLQLPGEKEGISHAILNREGATAQADHALKSTPAQMWMHIVSREESRRAKFARLKNRVSGNSRHPAFRTRKR